MKIIQTALKEILIFEPMVFSDERGWFMESFNERRFDEELIKAGLPPLPRFIQDNHSSSKKNVLRGLHYQMPPHAQGKLVRVTKGRAFDVAVDIREGSPTFGQHVEVELSAANHRMLWIPAGFAHGFVALEDDTHFVYKTTDVYNKNAEASIRWDDPELAIHWPIRNEVIVNDKDQAALSFASSLKMPYTPVSEPQKLVDLQVIGDHRGSLIVLEKNANLPFNLQRAYYIFNTQANVSRGFHAHKKLQQLAICVAGKCCITLDDGKEKEHIWLDSPTKGLLIREMVWREMHDFSDDCVLIVFASHHYDEADYIRNYDDFIKEVRQ